MKLKTHFFRFLSFISSLFLLAGCAQVVSPSGGKVDSFPPVALKYFPDSAPINFNSKQIEITFNEFIQVKDLNSQLIVTPTMEIQPEVRVKNKQLIIDLKEELQPNTTYSFNFGNSISDITENNVAENFQYVLSTGSYIDSLKLSGKIVNAYSLSEEKGITIMLYSDLTDSVPFNKKPVYFTKSGAGGSFLINYIKTGKYKVFALKDENANFMYNPYEEQIAFLDSNIFLDSVTTINLRLFQEKPVKQFVKKSIASTTTTSLIFNLPVDSIKIDLLKPAELKQWIEYSKSRDTVTIFNEPLTADSLVFIVSDYKSFKDTQELRISKPKGGKGSVETGLQLKTNVSKSTPLDINGNISLSSSLPVKTINDDLIFITHGTDTINFSIKSNALSSREFDLETKLISDSIYQLTIYPGAFTDIAGQTNDTLITTFTQSDSTQYGNVEMKLSLKKNKIKYLVQLQSDKGDVINEKTISKSELIRYTLLKPGEYKLIAISDENENGKWDTGNYLLHIQPEPVKIFSGKITIRANWDQQLEWKVD